MNGNVKHWIIKAADLVIRHAEKQSEDGKSLRIVCASGISPSGAIHIGNLREVMTVHLVVEELLRRGYDAEHIHSWDDFDRLRKIPAGIPSEFEEHIGRALTGIPDPFGEYPSYADRHITEFEAALEPLGIHMRSIRQSQAYPSGLYREQIKTAMAQRSHIFDILVAAQTPGRNPEPIEQRRKNYYPFQVYCHNCKRDITKIDDYEESSATITYSCNSCDHQGSYSLNDDISGKLVWKVDWPMRWKHEQVIFEPGGPDHATPGSSFSTGKEIVSDVFNGRAPCFVQYAFVGMAGQSKISSSIGGGATPAEALRVIEPAILRWLYIRRDVKQNFSINLDEELVRVYDEWDKLAQRVADGTASEKQVWEYQVARNTSNASMLETQCPVSFRVLSSVADIANGDVEQIIRIIKAHIDSDDVDEHTIEPRLTCALNWLNEHVAPEDRTTVRDTFHTEAWSRLSQDQKSSLQRFLELLDDNWSLSQLTKLVYGVPKLQLGLDFDAKPSEEIKQGQRDFFASLYTMLIDSETGPRLPTLLLSVGKTRIRQLLISPEDNVSV